jgi:hypothetical protein
MNALVIVVRIFCLLPFVTGLADLVLGPQVFGPLGLTFPAAIVSDPALNSQIGFWGAIWFGMALLLWKCTTDLVENQGWFYLLCGILFLSGVGRAIAAIRFGLPPAPLSAAMALELIGIPPVILWHRFLLNRLGDIDAAEHAK